jgi:hypothetical protein
LDTDNDNEISAAEFARVVGYSWSSAGVDSQKKNGTNFKFT